MLALMYRALAGAVVVCTLVACGGDGRPGGTDAGTAIDSGTGTDASIPTDTGAATDARTGMDAGTRTDAGNGTDAGVGADSGGRCAPGTCIVPGGEECEEPSGPLGNGCCECADDGTCSSICRCAAPDTPVETPAGARAIAELREGDAVYSLHRGRRVAVPIVATRIAEVRDHAAVRVTLESGAVIVMSPLHPTAAGTRFADLRPGDHLGTARVASVELAPYPHATTHDILPAGGTGTYYVAGALVGSTLSE
jgi:hypothetical protein